MAIYAIGDVQGCIRSLLDLLERIGFSASRDRLLFVGDLVNRGPGSVAVLRTVKSLGEAALTLLCNHDLHLLAVAEGFAQRQAADTLDEVLAAPDRAELLDWLRHRPLMQREGEYALVHAGLLPAWTVAQALDLAAEVEEALRGASWRGLLADLYGNRPDRWDHGLEGTARLRVIINAMTRMRVCTGDGAMDLRFTGTLAEVPAGYLPWFDAPGRASRSTPIVFGHWSALGLMLRPDALALDTGCVWGGQLTAVRLEDRRVFQIPCAAGEAQAPAR